MAFKSKKPTPTPAAPLAHPAAPVASPADGGWQETTASDNAARWLTKEDFALGLVWQGRLVDAFLIANDTGGYKPVYVLKLTAPAPRSRESVKVKTSEGPVAVTLKVGDTVAFSEKAKLSFRAARIGDEVKFAVLGQKEVGKPSPMLVFKLATRPSATGGAIINEQLRASFTSRRQGGSDPWAVPAELAAHDEQANASQGDEEVPF